jgi:glycosyltransferase involved in cell wall biosynthesis
VSGGAGRLVAAASAAAWLAFLGLAARTARHRRRAPPLPAATSAEEPAQSVSRNGPFAAGLQRVAVLLPVRDEEENLGPCLDGLLAQAPPPGFAPSEIVVIDDGSRDATRSIAADRAAAEPRLTVLDAGPPPPGWGGKVHALHRGYEHLRSAAAGPPGWVLSTDADTRHHPRLLARALAAAAEHRLDAVSVAGHQEVRGLAENLLTPPVFALLDALLGDWAPVARGDGPPVANGQFLLMREPALARAGGFAAVRGVAIDDLGLVMALRRAGGRTGFFRAPDLLRVRMYRGASKVYRGWRRNLGGLFGGQPRLTAVVTAFLLLPFLLLIGSVRLAMNGRTPTDRRRGTAAAGVLWASGAAASARLRASGGHHPAWGFLYPLDALVLGVTLLQGVRDWRRGSLLAWKGRGVTAR